MPRANPQGVRVLPSRPQAGAADAAGSAGVGYSSLLGWIRRARGQPSLTFGVRDAVPDSLLDQTQQLFQVRGGHGRAPRGRCSDECCVRSGRALPC